MVKENYTLLMIFTCANGFFNLGIFAIAFEMAVHKAKPYNVGEATNCGFINVMSNLVGFVLVLGVTPLLKNKTEDDVLTTYMIHIVILVISFMLIAFS